MDTPMLKKLREYLRITPKKQKEQDWKEVKEMGLKGVTAEELINNTYFRLVWCFVNDEKNIYYGTPIKNSWYGTPDVYGNTSLLEMWRTQCEIANKQYPHLKHWIELVNNA